MDIIKSLCFDLWQASPVAFLERYLRIFNLDLCHADEEAFMISVLAFSFCKVLLRSNTYLTLRPSQVAAAALTLAVSLSKSPIVTQLGF